MNPKKMRKLLRDPKLFFKDMLHKRLPRKSNTVPALVKKKGTYSYSVVAAVYGVEKYLDDFFKSLVNQTLDFKSHIQLIMVDDGSLDGSAEIIKKWQKKYPDNIFYLKKENGGQASARNLGMEYATGDWIAFVDPDDFLDVDYVYEVDKHLSKQSKEIVFVSCSTIFFHEEKNQFSDSHPLNYRFKKENLVQINDENIFYQLSASSVFFNSYKIRDHKLKFSEDIKPNFEDGEFVSRLLLLESGRYISYLPSAKYYYRKRSDGTSTLDKSFLDERRYSQLVDNGYLRLLEKAKNDYGIVPRWLQSTMLYELVWIVKSILTSGHKLSFLTDDEKNVYINKLKKIASFIDDDLIISYSLAGCWFFHKVGILGFLKNKKPNFSISYVESWDKDKELLCIKYFWVGDLPEEVISVGGREIFPVFEKNRKHDFFGSEFVCERILWLSIPYKDLNFNILLNNEVSRLSINGKQYSSDISSSSVIDLSQETNFNKNNVSSLSKSLRKKASNNLSHRKFKNCWIFMDRDTMADDNAEHLYRYVVENHVEVNAFFVLRKNSSDWDRLKSDGFNLLSFDSEEHHIALLNADYVISSHADAYVVNLLSKKDYADILKYKYVFLQHGVTKDDLSKWLNNKPISLFVTATKDEYISIVKNNSKYKFGKGQVLLTGFPRHDRLLKLNEEKKECVKKNIVIMPTWRNGLVGAIVGSGNGRQVNNDFFDSFYAVSWKKLLLSTELKFLSEKYNANLIFYPHANIDIYIDGFEVPDYISIKRSSNSESMQITFVETDILITDYSSVAFEVGYLKKPVIYYQFDRDEVFSGGHIYEKGYFDYERNGFGPVCLDYDKVIFSLSEYLKDPEGEMWGYYKGIADRTFEYRDGRCCERVFEAIRLLRKPEILKDDVTVFRLRTGAKSALTGGFSQIAIQRYHQCYELSGAEEDVSSLISLLSKKNRYGEVIGLYEIYGVKWSVETVAKCLDAFVTLGCNAYFKQVIDYNSNLENFSEYSESLLKYAAARENAAMFSQFLQKFPNISNHSIDILSRYLKRDWEGVRATMRFSSDESLLSHFDLFLQACFRTNCIEYAEQVFKEISDQIEPAMANVYAVRIKLAYGEFDEALEAYEVLGKSAIDSLAMEDIDNWLKLRQYKKSNECFSAENGLKLLRRFFDDSEVASLIVEQTDFSDLADFERVLEIFSDRAEATPPLIALFIFKQLVSLHRYEEADQFVLNASYAAKGVSDRALIADFQKMNAICI